MKKYFYLFTLLFLCYSAYSQPVINSSDMPATPDTIRFRSASFVTGLDYEQTGMNYTWDFSSLNGTSTGADTFVAMSATPLIYQLTFLLGSNNANMASPQGDFNFIPGFQMNDLYNFHKKQTSNFTLAGMGASISGIPIPIKFNTADVIYKFPITAGTEDSCQVSFSMGITGLGYLDIQKKRHNYVDGWGTLILPTGSFQAIRVKSVITETDSLYVDSLGMGMAIPRNSIEYKWLTDGCGIPQLQVTEQYGLIATWKWIDETALPNNFTVTIGNDTTICAGEPITLTANVTGGTPSYTYIWNNFSFGQSITVTPDSTSTFSVTVADGDFNIAVASITVTVIQALTPAVTTNGDYICIMPYPVNNTAILTTAAGYSWYEWSTGQSGASLNSIYAQSWYVGDSTFSVTVTNSAGCQGSTSHIIHFAVCSGIDELVEQQIVGLYPNPASGALSVVLSSSVNEISRITLSDETGKQLRIFDPMDLQVYDTKSVLTVNDINLPAGFYILTVQHSGGTITQKLVIR